MRHINIPVFIPHLGCPNNCVFCNQRTISGTREFHEEEARGIIERALATVPADSDVEIAFFGGSFTGIDRGLMLRLPCGRIYRRRQSAHAALLDTPRLY